ncbi:RNA-binding S4 domain-containing protein [Aquincola tertiaricarbonis]|uniref:RNA-binding S4 domain-containing protein n=1 Tax=Aquincola tertiaricarbonis TaxID=391953 RepID=A0ABY4SG96_AQUTE|nr:RNA-binding S4 domain-containing protein [Aquincola tertiaricarbonis]URI10902.1 RNA-binding S4 domain-containing protein [Aquincola tertiaricarbonis]
MPDTQIPLRGDYITLDNLLKVAGIAHSGGAAKLMVADGLVQVDGAVELRKTAKIRAGQVVQVGPERIRVTTGMPGEDELPEQGG